MIDYRHDAEITPAQFIDVLERSGLAERRPVDHPAAIEAMLRHGNLCVTAWDGDLLVGVSRSLTDFAFVCYLSDLAVDRAYQRSGIGLDLIRSTQERLDPTCKILLLAAPAATEYYPRIGFAKNDRCWELPARPLLPSR